MVSHRVRARMRVLWRSVWQEPRAPGTAAPGRSDWIPVVALVAASLLEGTFRDDVQWRAVAMGTSIVLAMLLPWRRIHPLGVVAIAFGTMAVVQSAALLSGIDWAGLDTHLFLLILPYALLRWGSGRQIVWGLAVMLLAFVTALPGVASVPESVGAGLFLSFPAALGAAFRFADHARRRAANEVRLLERARLARELHDTVAHHVSAIAIQAQAGRARAGSLPEAPLDALVVIEEAASRTLSDMRTLVRALREDGEVDKSCAHPEEDRDWRMPGGTTLADIAALCERSGFPFHINVTFAGNLDDLDAAVGTTLHRLTREALTNAARHACGATGVSVSIVGTADEVRLNIVDNGARAGSGAGRGFGLRGMDERVTMLGGTLRTGPAGQRGWRVEANLPRGGKAR